MIERERYGLYDYWPYLCRYLFLYNLHVCWSLCYLSVVTLRKELIRCLPGCIYHNLIRCKRFTPFLTDVSHHTSFEYRSRCMGPCIALSFVDESGSFRFFFQINYCRHPVVFAVGYGKIGTLLGLWQWETSVADPDPGWIFLIIFPKILKQFFGLNYRVPYLNSLMRIRYPGDPGSGIRDRKNSDPWAGINIPDPQHCWRLIYFN